MSSLEGKILQARVLRKEGEGIGMLVDDRVGTARGNIGEETALEWR